MSDNRYTARAISAINRDTSFTEEAESKKPNWFDEFERNLEKNAVQSQRSSKSIYDQISAILGNSKSKYSSVEEAVQDMQQRTGLTAFLTQQKKASQEPEIFQKLPEMKIFIDNYIAARPGTSVEAVVHDLLKLDNVRNALPDNDVDNEIRTYINNKITDIKSMHGSNNDSINFDLGKVEDTSKVEDPGPLAICEPAVK